jgi:hypothetical protein
VIDSTRLYVQILSQEFDHTLTCVAQDYTPATLTNWGWNLVKSDPEVAGGAVIHNLLTRAFPSHYRGNSVYAMFPFVHPDRTKEILTKIGKVDDYDFSRPHFKHHPLSVKSYAAVDAVLNDKRTFQIPCKYQIPPLLAMKFVVDQYIQGGRILNTLPGTITCSAETSSQTGTSETGSKATFIAPANGHSKSANTITRPPPTSSRVTVMSSKRTNISLTLSKSKLSPSFVGSKGKY